MAQQLSTAHASLIRELCQDVERWAPGETAQPRLLRLLEGGHSNVTALVCNTSSQWVLRIPREPIPDTRQREQEIQLHLAAAAAGLAPELCYHDAQRGILIMRYVHGEHDVRCDLPRLARLLRQIHALPQIGPPVHTPALLGEYHGRLPAMHRLRGLLEDPAHPVARAAALIESQGPCSLVLCHNDLLLANRLVSAARLLALDWEYAAPGDPFFDIAVCASELSPPSALRLLETYLARPAAPAERARLDAQQWLYAAIEACWHALHHPGGTAETRCCDRLLSASAIAAPQVTAP